MQGWRVGMEDAHICLPSLPGQSPWQCVGLFGVMDGHGGEQVAKFCERHLPEELCTFPIGPSQGSDIATALTETFHRMDELLRDRSNLPELRALTNARAPEAARHVHMQAEAQKVDVNLIGCTACFCCVTESQLIVANAGDSRAVLCRGGRAVALSEDHKPNDRREKHRIEAAGGYVENSAPGQYRVNGNLNLSRALGDLEYKKDPTKRPQEQIISATPDVRLEQRSDEDEFLVICCDGVWDVMTNQEVVDFIRNRLPREHDIDPGDMMRTLEALLDNCVSPDLRLTRGLGGDNMTAVLVRFPLGQSTSSLTLQSVPQQSVGAGLHGQLQIVGIEVKTFDEVAGGAIVVRVALPAGCGLSDLSLRVSEVTTKLEVSVAETEFRANMTSTFCLQEHLPRGAELSPPTSAPAKFSPKSDLLKISLPWRPVE